MLTIRQAQLDVFRNQPQIRLEADLARHLRRYFPHECARGDVSAFVRMGLERAATHGFDTVSRTALYLNLMAMLGAEFDEDPQIPWAGKQLDDLSIPDPAQRLDDVYLAAVAFLAATSGQNSRNLVRAKLRIRKLSFDFLAEIPLAEAGPALASWLRSIFPEKADRIGESALQELTQRGAAAVEEMGASTARSGAIHALHMYMLGSGYLRDPLYPWASKLVNAKEPRSIDQRFDQVLETSLAYMETTMLADPSEQEATE